MVILHKRLVDAGSFREMPRIEALEDETTLIPEHLWLEISIPANEVCRICSENPFL